MTRILVTGGAGFIGLNTARALLAAGFEVRVLDRLAQPVHMSGEWPAQIPSSIERVHGNVCSRTDLLDALNDVHVVLHLAAYQDYLPDFSTFMGTNATATALLYELIVSEKLPVEKVVIASSQAVYGEGPHWCPEHGLRFPNSRPTAQLRKGAWEVMCDICGYDTVSRPATEITVNPQNSYAISKLCQELVGINLGRRYDIPTVALRYSITQGPGQSPHNAYSGICRIFTTCALQGLPLPIYEDGGQIRDYVHIEDVVAANLLAISDSRLDYQVFNVGGRESMTVLAYANLVRDVAHVDVSLKVEDSFRVGDTRHIVSDSSRLKTFGWKQTKGVREIIGEYLSWAAEQRLSESVAPAALAQMRSLGAVGVVE